MIVLKEWCRKRSLILLDGVMQVTPIPCFFRQDLTDIKL